MTLHAALLVVAGWLALGVIGVARPRRLAFIAHVLFPAGAALGVVLAAVAFVALHGPVQEIVLPLGLPDLPFHLRLDPLAALFLAILGIGGAGVSLFSAGYF